MNTTVYIALYGWIPVVLLLFALLGPRRAVIVSFLLAWLFLPMASITLVGVPNLTKSSVTVFAVMLGITLFDGGRLMRFRLRVIDVPMVVWTLVPMASAVTAGYSVYDGASAVMDQAITWAGPYFIGRLYMDSLDALHDLALAVFIGGLLYAPLCLYEIRMSPQLHTMVYGYHQHVFAQSKRYEGWRPVVFMQHGLAVGMWMTLATLMGLWLWQTKAVRAVRSVPMALLAPALLAVTILCKSVGALVLLAMGVAALTAGKWMRSARPAVLLLMIAPAYLVARIVLGWGAEEVIAVTRDFDTERAASLEIRIGNEDRLLGRILQRPLFGWGPWGDFRHLDDEDARVITDSLWIIAFGRFGALGLTAMTAAMLLPVVMFMHRTRLRNWHDPLLAPASGIVVVVVLFMIDGLFNAMLNPICLLGLGGVAGLVVAPGSRPRRHESRSEP
jgi:O-antigen ligase